MFVNLSIHHPRSGYEADLSASMHRFGAAAAGAPESSKIYRPGTT